METVPAQSLIEALPDGCALLDLQGRIRHANRPFTALFDARVEGRTLLELTRSVDADAAVQAALGGRQRRLELVLPVARRTLLCWASPLEGGALFGARDVTEAKRMELARRDFVANASHELRTPVTAICGAAETLLAGAVDQAADARMFVEMISRHADRLSRLTQELLDLSRIESGEWQVKVEPLDASALCRSTLELFRSRALSKSQELVDELPSPLMVQGDRRALEQVLVNLLDNAVKYSPQSARIRLSAEVADGHTTLSVHDSGPGIERHHLERLFERFYRADGGRARDAGGTGLGLAIVKHLAQAQGGEVGVDSGRTGSRFWIRLRSSP